jgi:hypothetical protein
MRAFFRAWPASKILQTSSAKSIPLPELAQKFPLPWSAYVRLLSVQNQDSRSGFGSADPCAANSIATTLAFLP